MYSINVNSSAFKTDIVAGDEGTFEGTLNDAFIKGNLIKINDYQYHLIYNHQSYQIDLMKLNASEKTMTLKINSVKYHLELKDKYDDLLKSLGMDTASSKKVNDIKAPMPGMVLNVLVREGAEVKKGDVLLVLEAMKMENMLKSPADGIVKKIAVQKGTAVEKNQLLIQF